MVTTQGSGHPLHRKAYKYDRHNVHKHNRVVHPYGYATTSGYGTGMGHVAQPSGYGVNNNKNSGKWSNSNSNANNVVNSNKNKKVGSSDDVRK